MKVKEVQCEGLDYFQPAQDRVQGRDLVHTAMKISGQRRYFSFRPATYVFSRTLLHGISC